MFKMGPDKAEPLALMGEQLFETLDLGRASTIADSIPRGALLALSTAWPGGAGLRFPCLDGGAVVGAAVGGPGGGHASSVTPAKAGVHSENKEDGFRPSPE